jgi:hypothetical protein
MTLNLELGIPENVRRYGYWTVDGIPFFSKPAAYDYVISQDRKISSGTHDKPIRYAFNDAILSAADWTKEPEPNTSIKEFYRRRAQQLRDKYDYVILMYSGGPDSTNVLRTFVDNDILIDEIVNFNSYDRTGVLEKTNHNRDYYYNVEPTLKRLIIDNNLKTKITIVDEIEATKQYWGDCIKAGNEDILFENVPAPTMFLARPIGFKYIPHIWKMIQAGKNICIVVGSDKCDIHADLENNKYFWFTGDVHKGEISTNHLTIPELKNFNGFEFFYHSPDCVPLLIKQAHILKNFLDTNTNKELYSFNDPSVHVSLRSRISFQCQNKRLPESNLRYDIYHKILYPDWRPAIITPKPRNLVLRPEDSWWIHKLQPELRSVFSHGLLKNIKKYKDLGFYPGDLRGLPGALTKKYYIE